MEIADIQRLENDMVEITFMNENCTDIFKIILPAKEVWHIGKWARDNLSLAAEKKHRNKK